MNRRSNRADTPLPVRLPPRPGVGLSGGMTPGRLRAILDQLSAGECFETMSFFDQMEEKDLHIGAVAQTRALSAASPDREVVAASERVADTTIADFIRDVVAAIPRLKQSLTAMMAAVTHGFSMTEMILEVVEGKVVVKQLVPRPQRLFTFVDRNGPDLLSFPDYVVPRSGRWQSLPREKFIFHTAQGSAHPVDAGIYRGVAWSYLFANMALKDWMTFMDLYGVPLRLGKYKPTTDDTARAALKNAVLNLGSDAAAVIADDTSIEFVSSALSGDHALFQNAVEHFNRQVSKRVLGQTLTTDGGDKGSGSFALGKVHQKVRADITLADIHALDETLTADLVRPLVDLNFGPQKRYPKIVTRLSDVAEIDARLAHLKTLVELGAVVPAHVAARITGVEIVDAQHATLGHKVN